jgi:hypothetical protein
MQPVTAVKRSAIPIQIVERQRGFLHEQEPHPNNKPRTPSVVTVVPAVVTVNVVLAALDDEVAADAGIVIEFCVKLHELSFGTPVHCNWIVPANPLRDVTETTALPDAP